MHIKKRSDQIGRSVEVFILVQGWPLADYSGKNLASVSGFGLGVISDTTTIVTSELSNITTTGMISYSCSPIGNFNTNLLSPPCSVGI